MSAGKRHNLQGQVVRLETIKLHLENEIERLNSIIKEVREYIENNSLYEQDYTYDYEENIEEFPPDDTKARKELLEILDKVGDIK